MTSSIVDRVIPFPFLPTARRRALEGKLEERRYPDGATIERPVGEALYLVDEGAVEILDAEPPHAVRLVITAGQYYGERGVLFEQAPSGQLRACGPVRLWRLAAEDFCQQIDDFPAFAQALSSALRHKHGIFGSYQRLYARLLSLLDQRAFLLSELLPAYLELTPALHPLAHDTRIDVGALGYAVARLPEGVTGTTFYYLCSSLPELYRSPDDKFQAVQTRARRRASWQVMPGKLLVLLRDGISDVTDLLTCMCVYSVEARKIRRRLRSHETLLAMRRLVDEPDPEAERELLRQMPLSDEERRGLERIWPDNTIAELHNVLLHHEDVGMECDLIALDYNASSSEQWVTQIREQAQQLVDLDDPELEVHIISSNTHSVANCLSPYLARRALEIHEWGREQRPELCGKPGDWHHPRDLVYVLARDHERQHEGARERRIEEERASGHHRLGQTAFTGIAVDLIDLRRVQPDLTDPDVGACPAKGPALLVNVDYAFGQQAEEILATLLFLFGRAVRSVSVVGKAGGLAGRRGDILLPSATLLQTNDELYPIGNDLDAITVESLVPGRTVHRGPVLTVPGTLLQDRTLLHFYRSIWKCVGLEMEGSYFARQLHTAAQTGVTRPDLELRFAYYVSDLPLHVDDNLSESLAPWEGVPPLYGVTRAVLQRIFASLDEPFERIAG